MCALETSVLLIRVNAVAPGAIETPMLRVAIERNNLNEADILPVLTLFNRLDCPEEVALASLKARWFIQVLRYYLLGSPRSAERRLKDLCERFLPTYRQT